MGRTLPGVPEESALPMPDFGPVTTNSGFLASRPVRKSTSAVLSPVPCGHLLPQPQDVRAASLRHLTDKGPRPHSERHDR